MEMESFMFLVFKSIFKSGDKLTLGAQCPPHLSGLSLHIWMESGWRLLSGHQIQVRDSWGLITMVWDHSPSPSPGLHSLKSIKILLEKARRVTQTNTKISSAIHIKEF